MTQAQLNSMAKRVNTALVQYAKTFGVNSDAYKNYESKIFNVFGEAGTHTSKSGHLSINLGKSLLGKEESLTELDRPYNKVKGQMKASESLIRYEMKKDSPDLDVDKVKIPKEIIISRVEDIARIQNFFDNEIADMYTVRKDYPAIDNLLKRLEKKRGKGNKISYEVLYTTIKDLEYLYEQYNREQRTLVVTDDEATERASTGTKLGS